MALTSKQFAQVRGRWAASRSLPLSQPEPEPETPFSGNPCNGDWWKWRPPPRPPLPTAPKVEPLKPQPQNECDKELAQRYSAVAGYFKYGGY